MFLVEIGSQFIVGAQDRCGMHEQIVEVDRIVLEQVLLIGRVDLAYRMIHRRASLSVEHFRSDGSVFQVADSLDNVRQLQMRQRNVRIHDRLLDRGFRIVGIED